jgi:hypothetical protein
MRRSVRHHRETGFAAGMRAIEMRRCRRRHPVVTRLKNLQTRWGKRLNGVFGTGRHPPDPR